MCSTTKHHASANNIIMDINNSSKKVNMERNPMYI